MLKPFAMTIRPALASFLRCISTGTGGQRVAISGTFYWRRVGWCFNNAEKEITTFFIKCAPVRMRNFGTSTA